MLRTKSVFIFLFLYSHVKINAVPPEACFANFRWDDCGRPPQRVLYYWKPGSRCEVGTWRGCLPNINMFHDEYECVNTCVFTARAEPEDYHKVLNEIEDEEVEEEENESEITTAIDVTSSITDDNATTIEVSNVTSTTVEVSTIVPGNSTDAGSTMNLMETNYPTTVQTNDNVLESNETGPADDTATDINSTPQ